MPPLLPDSELDKLCAGRIVKANVYNSAGTNATEPHHCVILDAHPQVPGRWRVAVISHNDKIDSVFLMPVPAHTGLTGFIVGSWTDYIDEPGILSIGKELFKPELLQAKKLARDADAARTAKSRRK
ncbi:MAG: hypothetical protein L0Y71_17075 [Gemmataceae bacterium]|nr:hypothetical protein [Gemmataceae bacterium]